MAGWTKTSEGTAKNPSYGVWSTTLSPRETSQAEDVNWTAVIDFVPPGTDFTVIANTAGSNLSSSSHLELFIGYSRSAPNPVKDTALLRYRSDVTPFKPVTGLIDNQSNTFFRDVSAQGQYPYYWLKIPDAGGTGGATVIIKIIIGRGATEVLG